jgi:hypothetical protein
VTHQEDNGRSHGLRNAWLILALTMAVRTIIAARYPLLPDETYFWEWSRRLAAGYFDHPPGIAWVIAGGAALIGDTTLGVRLGPLACNVLAAGALILAARDLGGERAAMRASLLFALLPLTSGLILATPDAPLAAAVSVTLFATLRATAEPRAAVLWWWLLAGLASGLAMATKLSGVFAPMGVAVACMVLPAFRWVFRTPGPYVATLVAAGVMVPVLRWNAAHEWIAFTFQLSQGYGDSAGSVLVVASRMVEFVGGQLLITAVLPGLALFAVAAHALRGRLGSTHQFLAVAAVTAFAPFVASAFRQHGEPNWTAVAYPALLILLAAADAHIVASRRLRYGLALAATMVVIGYARALGALPIAAQIARHDPLAEAHGWDGLARLTDSVASATRDGGTVFIAADRYQDASEIAFHARGQPVTLSLNLAGRPNQYDYWPVFAEVARTGDALVVAVDEVRPTQSGSAVVIVADTSPQLHRVLATLEPHFAEVRRGPLVSGVGDPDHDRRRIWVLRDWRGTWPEGR